MRKRNSVQLSSSIYFSALCDLSWTSHLKNKDVVIKQLLSSCLYHICQIMTILQRQKQVEIPRHIVSNIYKRSINEGSYNNNSILWIVMSVRIKIRGNLNNIIIWRKILTVESKIKILHFHHILIYLRF